MHVLSKGNSWCGYVCFTINDKDTGKKDVVTGKATTTPYLVEQLSKAREYMKKAFNKNIPLKDLLDEYKKNTSTFESRKVAAKLLAGFNEYKATRIEWGYGGTPAQRSDTDLVSPFNPRVVTPISAFEFPTPDENVVKMSAALTNESLVLPGGGSGSVIREVGLRTAPIGVQHPDGLLIARFVNDADIPKTSSNMEIGVQWLYIYN